MALFEKNTQKGYLDGGMTLIFQENPRINLRQLFLLWLIFSRNSSSMVRRALAKNPIHFIFNFFYEKTKAEGVYKVYRTFHMNANYNKPTMGGQFRQIMWFWGNSLRYVSPIPYRLMQKFYILVWKVYKTWA